MIDERELGKKIRKVVKNNDREHTLENDLALLADELDPPPSQLACIHDWFGQMVDLAFEYGLHGFELRRCESCGRVEAKDFYKEWHEVLPGMARYLKPLNKECVDG